MILGIDESGRGPVIGDMVIAGVLLPSSDSETFLVQNGVRDSKEVSKKKRELLYPLIEKASTRILTKIISASEIDSWRSLGQSLNELEAKYFAEIIRETRPERAIVDCADVVPETFRKRIMRYAGDEMPELVCEHFADRNYPVVSAASIIAKVTRDRRISSLQDTFGQLGSGYCSDWRTLEFLENWFDSNGSFPSFVRKTWCTACRIRDNRIQKKLTCPEGPITSRDI